MAERLVLCPLDLVLGESLDRPNSTVTQLTMHRDYRVFGQLDERCRESDDMPMLETLPIPASFQLITCDDEGEHPSREDTQGRPLRYIMAGELKKLNVPSDSEPPNQAIKAFVDGLSDDIPIVLYWA